MMNWEQIANQWQQFSHEAKKKWSLLTDKDLNQINGSRNNLATIIQKQYFVSKKEAHDQIDVWIDALKV
jgi:uncharacterized protein YjbJ (UPF0337 family)